MKKYRVVNKVRFCSAVCIVLLLLATLAAYKWSVNRDIEEHITHLEYSNYATAEATNGRMIGGQEGVNYFYNCMYNK